MAWFSIQRSALLLLLGGLALTVWAAQWAAGVAESEARHEFGQAAAIRVLQLKERLDAYEGVLRGLQGFFAGSADVDRDEFRRYVVRLGLKKRLPGVQVVGFARRVPISGRDSYLASVRADRRSAGDAQQEFSIHPPGERPEYLTIEYTEPAHGNEAAFGFDLLSESARRSAAERARASGLPAATAPITLVQETASQASFLLLLPIYRNDARIATAEERQGAFLGVVYAAFRMEDLARGVYGDDVDRLDLMVVDVGPVDGAAADVQPLLHLTPSAARASPAPFSKESLLDFSGRRWRLRSEAVDSPAAVKRTATAVLAGGALISVLVFGLLQTFAGSRARALELADGMTRELRASEAHTRAVLDNTLDAIITIDERGLIESFNLAAEKLFRYATDDVLGRNVKMLMPEPYAAEHDGYLSAYRRTGVRRIIGSEREVVGKRADDSCFPMELAVTEVIVNDRRRFIGLMRDNTERNKMEQLKNEFVSTVSHELRTPLTSIRGSLGLLEGGLAGELPGQAKSLIGIAASNCERLVDLINDILDMEKIVSGRMSFDFTTQALMPLVEQAVEANQGFAVQHDAQFVIVARLAEGRARVDPDRFLQVLANLLSNAAKFSPAGGTVDVSLLRRGQRLRIEVVDRGPGIPEDFRARVFEKFSQADGSTTRAKSGSGLGLSISRTLVERMGGEIGFDSEPGRRTCFWFELPEVIAQGSPEPGGTMAGAEASSEPAASALRILHVEDDSDLVQVVAAQFGSSAEIIAARTLSTAKDALSSKTFDVVLLDLSLPDGPGLDLLPVIQRLARPPRVVVFSASDATARSAAAPGVAASLVKSRTSNERLVRIVRELMQPGP